MSDVPPPPPGFTIQDSSGSPPPPPPGFTIQSNNQPPAARRSGATGFGMVGELFHDLTTDGPANHDPNAIEQAFMGANNHPVVRNVRAAYQGAVADGPIMNGAMIPWGGVNIPVPGVRQTMELSGVGMADLKRNNPGQTDDWYRAHLHQSYNNAVLQARQTAAQEEQASRVGEHGAPTVQSTITGKPNDPSLGDRAARLGQQALGLGAGIVANPQYFAMPGAAVGNNPVTRTLGSAAINAAIGGASDVSAQLMDIAEGMQKDYDVTRSLQAAGGGALFGAGMHGATEVAPFVKGLFAKRGMDTTPTADPRTLPNITPLTGDHAVINQADAIQYRQLLHTGSVDDIKAFFKGRNGPQPSWSEVNQWVEHRDGPHPEVNGQPGQPNPAMRPDFDFEGEHNNQVISQWHEQNRTAVEEHINNQMSGWKNAPTVEVVHGPNDISDPAVRDQAAREDADGTALGFLGSDGKIRVFSGRITDPDVANAVLFHEGLGHFGLAQKFGDRLDQVIGNLLDRNVNQLSRDTAAWMKRNPKAYGGNRIRAAEEVLAEASQNGVIKKNWQNAVASAVRQFGRKMGLKLGYSDAEVQHVLAMSHDAVVNGKPGAAENGFRGVNKFMRQWDWAKNDNRLNWDQHTEGEKYKATVRGRRRANLMLTEADRMEERAREYRDDSGFRKGMMEAAEQLRARANHALENGGQVPAEVRYPKQDTYHPDNFSWHDRLPGEPENDNGSGNKFMTTDQLGRETTDPEHLDQVDRLKADPRFWSDPEYRANVIEMARTQHPVEQGPAPSETKFMRGDQFEKLSKDEQDKLRDQGLTRINNIMDKKIEVLQAMTDFLDDNRHMLHGDPEAILEAIHKVPIFHESVDDVALEEFASAIAAPKGSRALGEFLYHKNGEVIQLLKENQALADAKTPRGVFENLPPQITGNKFITRSQIASDPDYKSQDLERIYHTLDENYTPVTRTWEETRQDALSAGFTPAQIKALKETNPGDLSVRLHRMQSAANMLDMKLGELHDKLDTPEWSEKDQAEYIKALADFTYLVPRIKGERAEIARALNIAKAARSYGDTTMQQMKDILEQYDSGLSTLAFDPTAFMKFARQMKAVAGAPGSNPKGVQAMAQAVNKPYWWQYLTTFHMNAMLSGLSTHVKAPVDMMTGIARNVIEKAIAMPVGEVRKMYIGMTGKVPKPGVEVAEFANHIIGLTRAVTDMEVYKAALHAVKTGEGSYVHNGTRTPSNFASQFGTQSNPRIPGVSIPSDLISAQDTIFRSWEINAQLDSLGAREARIQLGKGATTSDVMTLGHTIASNPTISMIKEAYDLANHTLLLNDNPLNAWINKARVVRPNMTPIQQVTSFVASNLAPFIRVESNNLINRIIDRSPLGFVKALDPKSDIRKGGAVGDIAISKALYGSILWGLYWSAAGKGKDLLTGEGATSVDKYKQDIAAGRVPRAVHEGDRYNTGGQLGMSVNPFDLHNSTAQLVAGIRQSAEEGLSRNPSATQMEHIGTAIKLGLGSLAHSLADSSWISDFQPAVDATMAHGEQGEGTVSAALGGMAKSWVPNALGQAGRLIDPAQHDTTAPNSISGHVLNEMQNDIPGLRSSLPVKYSVYGDPLPNGASLTGVHTFIPGLSGNGTTETHDPAERELDRLNGLMESTLITPVGKTIPILDEDGNTQHDEFGKLQTRKLTPAEFEHYQQLAGRAIVETVRTEMATPAWAAMSDSERVANVRSIETDMKKAARQELFEQ